MNKKLILFTGSSNENKQAKRLLREHGFEFVQIFSEYSQPVLLVEDCIYSYKGIYEIEEFVATFSNIKQLRRQKLIRIYE